MLCDSLSFYTKQLSHSFCGKPKCLIFKIYADTDIGIIYLIEDYIMFLFHLYILSNECHMNHLSKSVNGKVSSLIYFSYIKSAGSFFTRTSLGIEGTLFHNSSSTYPTSSIIPVSLGIKK